MSHSASLSLLFPQLITRVCKFFYSILYKLFAFINVNQLSRYGGHPSPLLFVIPFSLIFFYSVKSTLVTVNSLFCFPSAGFWHYCHLFSFLHEVQVSHLPGITLSKIYHYNLFLWNIYTQFARHFLLSLYSCSSQPFTLGRTFPPCFLSCEI